MENQLFTAFVVEKTDSSRFVCSIKQRSVDDLPDGDVLVRVSYSSLNYKDALSATGNRGVTRRYPHTPGIDAAGIVEQSRVDSYRPGDQVIVTSYDLGMNTSGGFGAYIRVPADWVVRLPDGLSLKESMILGTAGFTAGLSVYKLTRSVVPGQGDILVTGATGGVGSLACAILAHLGYDVVGVSGKADVDLLDRVGVKRIIPRQTFLENTAPPLLSEKWAGVIDTVGGEILATAIKSARQDGVVTCCGNAASFELPINVYPFILRGVSLLGIDSQHCPMPLRSRIWEKLSGDWKFPGLTTVYEEIGLIHLDEKIQDILAGRLRGRTVVRLE